MIEGKAEKRDTNTTSIDYRQTTILAAIHLRPYIVGLAPLAQPMQIQAP